MDRPLHTISSLRRLRVSLLLPLLLVFAQHGAWLHELSHAAYAATAHEVRADQTDGVYENGYCPSCQSFGQLGVALTSPLGALPSPVSHLCPQTAQQYA